MVSLTAFFAGAVLMALELLGSRILAPTLGSSIFVWGSLIGVVLAALSAGYALGGAAADRWPSRAGPALVLVASALWILLLAARGEAWVAALAARVPGPRLAPLAASAALFLLPGLLLGSISPWVVRLAAPEAHRLGRVAGHLYAVSTAGSIAGTWATSFWLIPWLDTTTILKALAAVLAGTALLLAGRRHLAVALPAAAVLGLAVVPPPAPVTVTPDGARVLFQRNTLYHHLRVEDRGDSRFLRFDNSWQSGMYLDDPVRARFEYTDVMHAGWALNPQARRVLLVGLGGGSIPKRILASYPDATVDVVELDPVVVDVARRYFFLPSDPRLRVYVDDGRRFVRQAPGRYDLVMLDAYYADAIPFHLTTVEFLEEVRSRLAPGGVVVANVIGSLEGPRSALLRAFYRTYREVFPEVYLLPVLPVGAEELQNVILLARDDRDAPGPLPAEELARAIAAWTARHPELEALAAAAGWIYDRPVPVDDVPVLRDAYAPVDALLHFERENPLPQVPLPEGGN
ncbi:Spermine synthase [Thermaerobacter marianensis DSM 12885]|uniref:Polyamine aminopropyltransferase n=1 Tax=Thermaerobacter marianensis (strain ATCC 700841 / DSM 12885 / JCM 10246 / 7p75a) TaxID=644966 RepID=E6SM09_THEM7|nr:fused MFS/spermidine synthase [Thermaerobacter marianensis]ADU50339.1 Spermine synthase [Thermaerobacter marianensis DSM 12885]